jgi:hypothetical protein
MSCKYPIFEKGNAVRNWELKFSVECELVHNQPTLFRHKVRVGEDQAMRHLPEWLTIDLMIIAVAMVFIGTGVLIAP